MSNLVDTVYAQNVYAGQPVYIDQVSGKSKLANATHFSSSNVIGVVYDDTLANFSGRYVIDFVTLYDWTIPTSSVSLTPGDLYFLDTQDGKMINHPPSNIAGNSSVWVGTAVSPYTMRFIGFVPILL